MVLIYAVDKNVINLNRTEHFQRIMQTTGLVLNSCGVPFLYIIRS